MRCVQYLREKLPASRISVEVEKPRREGLIELAAHADVVFYSRSWAEVSRWVVRPSSVSQDSFPFAIVMVTRGAESRVHQRGRMPDDGGSKSTNVSLGQPWFSSIFTFLPG